MKIRSTTGLYCIFGKPVSHSLSPVIHNALFQHYSIDSVYLAFESDNIKSSVEAFRALNIKGASITIPHKIDVMRYIDEITPEAKRIGSINTLLNRSGRISGYNTDGYGIIEPLIESGVVINEKKILIIGNGGSARSAAFTLQENGAKILITGRSDENIRRLENDLIKFMNTAESVNISSLDKKIMDDVDIVINTTPVGMEPEQESLPLNPELIQKKHVVFDIVYKPDKTSLLVTAEKKGCMIIKGINMLIYQAMKQFEIWTGINPEYEIISKALNSARQ